MLKCCCTTRKYYKRGLCTQTDNGDKIKWTGRTTDELREAAERETAGAGGELQEAQALVVVELRHQPPEPLHLFAVLRVAPVDRVPPPVLDVDRHRLHAGQQHLRKRLTLRNDA